MVSACTEALTEGTCVLAAALPESAQPAAVALVLWKGEDYRQVTVRVGRGSGQWVVRSLTFAEADSPSERWVTVGLTVATLVGESAPTPLAFPASHAPASTTPVNDAGQTQALPRGPTPRRFDAELGLLGGPGWNDGGPQLGAWASSGVRLSKTPFSFHLFGSYAQSRGPDQLGIRPRTSWLTVGLSGAAAGTLQALDLRASAALELAFRSVRAEFNGEHVSDQELPLRIRVLAGYPADTRVALTGGAIVRLPPLGSDEGDSLQLRGPRIAVELLAGVGLRL